MQSVLQNVQNIVCHGNYGNSSVINSFLLLRIIQSQKEKGYCRCSKLAQNNTVEKGCE